jgi:hypothetical protein
MKTPALRTLAALFVVSLLTGCRSTPCSDKPGTAPTWLTDASESLPGSSVCVDVRAEHAELAMWADDNELRTKKLALRTGMRSKGWAERPGQDYYGKPYEEFVKGEDTLRLTFRRTKSPSFGAKIDREAAYASVEHSTTKQRAGR